MSECWDEDDEEVIQNVKWSLGDDTVQEQQQNSGSGWESPPSQTINGSTGFKGGKGHAMEDSGWEEESNSFDKDKGSGFGHGGGHSVGRGFGRGSGFGSSGPNGTVNDSWDGGDSSSHGFGGHFSGGFKGKGRGGVLGGSDADDAGGRSGGLGRGKGFGAGLGSGSSCRKCGEEGHFARECPNTAPGGGGTGCRICSEDGHYARDCPNREGFNQFTASKGTSGSSGKLRRGRGFGGSNGGFESSNNKNIGGSGCRFCHEEGHFAKECPNKGPDHCHKCGKEGHFARDCPSNSEQRPGPVSYIPPEPSEEEQDVFRTIGQGINFDKYDAIPCDVTGHGHIAKAIQSFEEANLYKSFLVNVKKAKYQKPTPVQKCAIPIILDGRDLMACAQTGSGKTAAFLLPVLTRMINDGLSGSLLSEIQAPAALVISPTRELACQIYMEARKFSNGTMLRPVVCYGGVSVSHQLNQIRNGCHILVATPGRLKDFVSKQKVSLSKVKYLILDEADRMLDMGFLPDIRTIIEECGMPSKENRQTTMFSATFPEEIQKLASDFMNDYIFLTIGRVGGTSSDIEQIVLNIPEFSKRDKLVEILGEQGLNRNLVFVQTKRSADFLASFLSQSGFPTTSIHGDRLQQQREEALRDFRAGRCPVLIATAVAARGLDIEDVKQVINYDLPEEIDEYVHRIGRTGRIGNKGKAISFFSSGKNEGLSRGLVKVLSDSDQVVPTWLEDAAETALGTGYGPKGGKYGAKDTRKFGSKNSSFKVGVYNGGAGGDLWGSDQDSGSQDNTQRFGGPSSGNGFTSQVAGGEDDWD